MSGGVERQARRNCVAGPQLGSAAQYPMAGEAAAGGARPVRCWRLDADTPLLVYTGLVTRNRGLELMLEALAQLPGFHLAMVGRAEPQIAAALARQAQALGVVERVHGVAPVPPEELIDFIASGDVAVIAAPDACLSYRYSLPNKLFEALFAGLPLVVTSELEDMRISSPNTASARSLATATRRRWRWRAGGHRRARALRRPEAAARGASA